MPTEPPKTGWDLHCHTVFSDGTETPTALVRLSREIGLHGVAITDHDTTAGWQEAEQAAVTIGQPLMRGTEITAHVHGVSVHMLAYLYNPHSQHIRELFETTRQGRLERTKRMVALMSKDLPISWDDVLAQVKQGSRTTIGRPHIADALVAAGVYRDRNEAFQGAVASSSPYYLPTPSPTAQQVVEAIRDAGGVTVIAHAADPSRNKHVLSDEQIRELADQGLDGLEVWHRGNPEDQRRRLLELARQCHLLVTGGSDWHGAGKPNALGEYLTDDETVARIAERGAIAIV
ncbi:PHP domain protein [Bifidobacterium gallicum DSM 20093 = LMG 11596]|uniref:PHP domain protein n=2 Tax=Bifidobacterium gallicum TaxID=78342 RepID=D1NSN9_9BIFI|nr:PHP domain protein [Bifidobacterium gallicum DSM 20093 = LMG 11596]KFI59283.1 phosphoesterase [Bifidobacterium gallicum DSM 20093 = LMG 11596]